MAFLGKAGNHWNHFNVANLWAPPTKKDEKFTPLVSILSSTINLRSIASCFRLNLKLGGGTRNPNLFLNYLICNGLPLSSVITFLFKTEHFKIKQLFIRIWLIPWGLFKLLLNKYYLSFNVWAFEKLEPICAHQELSHRILNGMLGLKRTRILEAICTCCTQVTD